MPLDWLAGLALYKLVETFGTSSIQSVVCNLVSAVGYDLGKAGVRRLVAEEAFQSPDLRRAVRTAECRALAEICEQELREEHGVEASFLGQLFEKAEAGDAWLDALRRRISDRRVQAVVELHVDCRRLTRRIRKRSPEELERETPTPVARVSELLRGEEALDLNELRTETTDAVVDALDDVGGKGWIPTTLKARIREHWFDVLRFALREELKRDPKAKSAFEVDVLARLDDVPAKLDELLERVAEKDRAVEGLWNGLEALAEGIDQLQELLQPKLELRLFERLGETNYTDARRLNPFMRTTEVIGREGEIELLREWLDSDVDFSVHVITGKAGTGKTRLALELCERVTNDQTWDAGFLSRDALEAFLRESALRPWRPERPTLVVLDYAAARAQQLRRWLQKLAQSETGAHRLRVLLLERHASRERGWMRDALGGTSPAAMLLSEHVSPEAPRSLDDRLLPDQARELFRTMFERSGGDFGDADADFDSKLTDLSRGRRPLLVLMAAGAAVEWGIAKAITLSSRELAVYVADQERDRIRKIAEERDVSPHLLWHLVATTTLSGGLPVASSLAVITEECEAIGEKGAPAVVDRALRVAMPIDDGRIPPLLPDLIGEAYVLCYFKKEEPDSDFGARLLERCLERGFRSTAEVVLRLAQDFSIPRAEGPQGTSFQQHCERLLEHLLAMARQTPESLELVAALIPHDTTSLRGWSDRVHEARLAWLERIGANEDRRPPLLSDLAYGLSLAGRREEAMAAAEEAVQLYRELAAARPDAFKSDLATSVSSLGVRLGDLGRREEALAAAEEAVQLYRELAAARPDAFTPDLAASVGNLANGLGELGRREEALAAAEEAMQLYRDLAVARPDAFTPNLAKSVSNLGIRLGELGRREEALAAAEEAVRLRRELAAARPDAFTPNLAASVSNLGIRLGELGRREEALGATEEAVQLYRELAAARPDAFTPDLAASVSNFAIDLGELGRQEEALAAAEEAVQLRRELAAARPDAFTPNLAASVSNLGTRLGEAGRREEALAAAEEAVQLFRELAAARPEAFTPNLAASASNLANRLSALGRREEALAAAEEAVRLLAPRFVALEEALGRWMEIVLRCYLTRCEEAERDPDEALLQSLRPFFDLESLYE
ncbi:MAG: tetratricopeptide repeat protein [Planctomycetota bacterium]